MKKILTMGLMCAATLAFTNCDKQDVEPQVPAEKTPFTIIASAVDTKTANDGLKTVWAENDALNVFHAVAGTTDYGTNDKFTFTGVDNKFNGNLAASLEAGKSYDWYALYPYSDFIKNPTNSDKSGYTYIGERSDQTQIQSGNDSKSHLIYDETKNASLRNCPLYAVAKNVAASSTPTFTMKHLASVVAVNVTNTNDAPLTVSSVSFTAPTGTKIVGTYYINFTDNGDALYVDGQFPGEVANLTVKSGTAIAKNGSAKFYLAIKPFVATSGQKLSISVNGYSKEITLDKNIEFQAGHIVPVNFKYDNTAVIDTPYYKADFEGDSEHRTEGVNSYTDNSYTVSGVEWTLKYADAVTTGSPLSGSAHIIARIKKNTTNKPSIVSGNLLAKSVSVNKVTFLSSLGNKVSLSVSYSINGGSSWNPLTVSNDKSVNATLGYSASLTDVTTNDFRLKFEWSGSEKPKSNLDSKIDDICVYAK
mgnify:CR=1 FL=1